MLKFILWYKSYGEWPQNAKIPTNQKAHMILLHTHSNTYTLPRFLSVTKMLLRPTTLLSLAASVCWSLCTSRHSFGASCTSSDCRDHMTSHDAQSSESKYHITDYIQSRIFRSTYKQ